MTTAMSIEQTSSDANVNSVQYTHPAPNPLAKFREVFNMPRILVVASESLAKPFKPVVRPLYILIGSFRGQYTFYYLILSHKVQLFIHIRFPYQLTPLVSRSGKPEVSGE